MEAKQLRPRCRRSTGTRPSDDQFSTGCRAADLVSARGNVRRESEALAARRLQVATTAIAGVVKSEEIPSV